MTAYLGLLGFVIVTVSLLFSVVASYRERSYQGRLLGRTSIVCGLVFVTYSVNYLSKDRDIMALACCLQYICILWAFYFMLVFVVEFCGSKKLNFGLRMFSIAVLMLDSAVILTGPINEIAFEIGYRNSVIGEIAVLKPKFFFWFHCLVCIFEISTIASFLIKKIVDSAKCYAIKYLTVLAILFLMAMPNGFFLLNESATYDYSSAFFGLAGFVLYLAVFKFSPIMLLRGVQGYMSAVVFDTVVLYDNAGNLLNSDARAEAILGHPVSGKEKEMSDELDISEDERTVLEKGDKTYTVFSRKVFDKKGKYVLSAYVFHDVTDSEKEILKEHQNATTDPLTGAYNRAGFMEYAQNMVDNHGSEVCFALMICGINNFKDINRLYGTKAGDTVLRDIAGRLSDYRKRFRMTYGRNAESKFILLLPFDEVDTVVSEMSTVPVNIGDDRTIDVNLRYGFVVMNEDLSFEEYCENALAAFVNSKKNEGFSVVEFSRDLKEEQKIRETLLADAPHAIENREFEIELQPHMNFREKKVVGAKAWVQWNHPKLGKLYQDRFMDLFNESGIVAELNRYIWRAAAETLERLKGSDIFNGYISVELDKKNIMDPGLTDVLTGLLAEYDIKPEKLHFVVRVCGEKENRAAIIRVLTELRSRGFYIEEADFGKGYSTISGIMTIPFDCEIISMEFLREAIKGDSSGRAAKALISAFASIDVGVVIVGVDSKEDIKILEDTETEIAEGAYFSAPVPLKEFVGYVKKINR